MLAKRSSPLNRAQTYEQNWVFTTFPSDFGVFFPYCCLHQPSGGPRGRRLPDEEMAYQMALETYELWYSHAMTSVLLLTESAGRPSGPSGELQTQPQPHYHKCGWSTLESLLSRLLKTRRADLWEPVIDVGHPTKSHLLPPVGYEAFKEQIAGCHFADRRDEEICLRVYSRALKRTLGDADTLSYDHAGWTDPELETLSFSLPMCVTLRRLRLAHNAFQAAGFIAFSQALGRGALPNLRELNLSGNPQVRDWKGALVAFAAAASPHLMSSSHDGPRINQAGLPRLAELNLEDCKIGSMAFFYFCRALQCDALGKLSKLAIDGNGVSNSGIEPLISALDRGAMPSLNLVIGIPGEGTHTFRDHLSQLKVLRKLSFRIDTRKDDASRRSGTANKLTVGSVEVQRIDGAIKQARATLDKSRRENKSGAQMLGLVSASRHER